MKIWLIHVQQTASDVECIRPPLNGPVSLDRHIPTTHVRMMDEMTLDDDMCHLPNQPSLSC